MQLFVFAVACNVFSCQLKHIFAPPVAVSKCANPHDFRSQTHWHHIDVISCQLVLCRSLECNFIHTICEYDNWVGVHFLVMDLIESTNTFKITHHLCISIANALNLNWNSLSFSVCVCVFNLTYSPFCSSLWFWFYFFFCFHFYRTIDKSNCSALLHFPTVWICTCAYRSSWINGIDFGFRLETTQIIAFHSQIIRRNEFQNESEKSKEKKDYFISISNLVPQSSERLQ